MLLTAAFNSKEQLAKERHRDRQRPAWRDQWRARKARVQGAIPEGAQPALYAGVRVRPACPRRTTCGSWATVSPAAAARVQRLNGDTWAAPLDAREETRLLLPHADQVVAPVLGRAEHDIAVVSISTARSMYSAGSVGPSELTATTRVNPSAKSCSRGAAQAFADVGALDGEHAARRAARCAASHRRRSAERRRPPSRPLAGQRPVPSCPSAGPHTARPLPGV